MTTLGWLETMMPRHDMDTARICHRHGHDTDFIHKRWSIRYNTTRDVAYFEVSMHHRLEMDWALPSPYYCVPIVSHLAGGASHSHITCISRMVPLSLSLSLHAHVYIGKFRERCNLMWDAVGGIKAQVEWFGFERDRVNRWYIKFHFTPVQELQPWVCMYAHKVSGAHFLHVSYGGQSKILKISFH